MLMEPGLLTRDQARELLADHHDKFAEAHREAWATWIRLRKVCHEAEADDLLLGLTPTTRANFVNNHCTKQVRGLIEPSEGVSFADLGFLAVLAYSGETAALVRFKVLDRRFRPSNVGTNVQRSLSKQEWPENLFRGLGVPTLPTVLTCGYRLNNDETEISGIHVCCHYKRELLWSYKIGDAASGYELIPLPNMPTPRPRITSTMIPESEDTVGDAEEQ